MITPDGSGHDQRAQDIEPIELELEKLESNFLDAMPRVRPVPGSVFFEDRHAVDLNARGLQHSLVDDKRAPTAEAGRNNDD